MSKAKQIKILIVDDEHMVIQALVEILSPDYAVFVAKDGQEAIRQAKRLLPDIILLDVIMPDMDGYDVINVLKSNETTKDTPVIFITGLDEIYAEEKALTLGASDYITKPFNSGIVKLRVRNQIKLIERMRQQALMTEVSHKFLSDAHIDELLTDTLHMVGEFMHIAKILLFMREDNDNTLTCSNEWIKPESKMESRIGEKLELQEPMLSMTSELPEKGEGILCFTSNEASAREAMKPYRKNYQCFIFTPIYVKGKLHAVIDFSREDDTMQWDENEINLAVLVSGIFSGVFTRNAIEHDLEAVLKLQTQLVAAKEQAEHSSRAKSEFLSRMSHEMLTPMNAITGMLRLIKVKPEKSEGYVNEIDKASKSLQGLINDVLDISGMEYGITELDESEFVFRDMLASVIKEAATFSDAKHQKVTSSVDTALPEVLIGDEKHLSQVINNLLANAIKFTSDSGEINIDVSVSGNEADKCTVQVAVADNGLGISKDQQKKLFQLFEQVDGSNSRKHGGIGIGLALSKRYIEMMDGKIWVESELGEGAKFIFTCKLRRAEQKSGGN